MYSFPSLGDATLTLTSLMPAVLDIENNYEDYISTLSSLFCWDNKLLPGLNKLFSIDLSSLN